MPVIRRASLEMRDQCIAPGYGITIAHEDTYPLRAINRWEPVRERRSNQLVRSTQAGTGIS